MAQQERQPFAERARETVKKGGIFAFVIGAGVVLFAPGVGVVIATAGGAAFIGAESLKKGDGKQPA